MTRQRHFITALVCVAALSGCDLNRSNNEVREGPQAVHPGSTAPGRDQTTSTPPAPSCGGQDQPACYTARAGDGSTPIIN